MMRSPFINDFVALRDTLERVVNEGFGDSNRTLWSRGGNGNTFAQAMPLDVYATDDQAVIMAAVPGMQPGQLDLTVHQHTVSLSGNISSVSETEEAKGATWYVHELGSGIYRRSVTLPFPIDADRVEASFQHGIVRIVLPKAEHAKPRRIEARGGQTESPEAIEEGETSNAKSRN